MDIIQEFLNFNKKDRTDNSSAIKLKFMNDWIIVICMEGREDIFLIKKKLKIAEKHYSKMISIVISAYDKGKMDLKKFFPNKDEFISILHPRYMVMNYDSGVYTGFSFYIGSFHITQVMNGKQPVFEFDIKDRMSKTFTMFE